MLLGIRYSSKFETLRGNFASKKYCWLEHVVISTGKFLSAFFYCGVTLKYISISLRTRSRKVIYVYVFAGFKSPYYFEI